MKKETVFVDIAKLSEDERIELAGRMAMQERKSSWLLTDDVPGKPERYREKLRLRYPLLRIGEIKRSFPVKGSAGFSVYPPQEN